MTDSMINFTNCDLTTEQTLNAYKKMLFLRRFEEKCAQLYSNGLIGGFCHLYIGQEAIIVGVDTLKSPADSTITSYRDHAHAILAGIPAKAVFAELMGKSSGCSKGKGGSMHMFYPKGKFYGGHGIVGAQVPLGTGIAFAEKYNGTNNICFTFLGDGAVNQGQVFEAYNMASLWKLPVVYIIENNEYSMGTSVARSTSMTSLYKKGESCNMPGYQVDAMNFQNVCNAIKYAIDYVRDDNGPILLEMKTYRYRGHSMSDPAKYRTKEEVEANKARDPILHLQSYLIDKKYSSDEELGQIDKEIKAQIKEDVEFAENSTEPSVHELYTDVYAQ